jgi:hypothetical protein
MRLKIAKAVDGSWYKRLKVVPGSLSRYSKDASDETDILQMARSCHPDKKRSRVFDVENIGRPDTRLKACSH